MTSTQHLFQSPKPVHRLHQFTRQDRLFIVDLDVGQVLETDNLMWEILQLCPKSTADEILEALSERYAPDRIYQAFEQLRSFEEMGILVGNTGREKLEKKNRPRIFVAGPIETWTSDKTYVRSGYRLASKEIMSALSKHADLFFHASKSEVVSDGVYTISGGTSRHKFLFQQSQIDGIFIPMIPLDMVEQMPLHLFSAQFINLIHALNQRQFETQAMSTDSPLPNLFCYKYDSNHGSVRSQALQRPHASSESIEVALAKEFLKSHSRLQTETLLTEICNGDRERACYILEKLSGLML